MVKLPRARFIPSQNNNSVGMSPPLLGAPHLTEAKFVVCVAQEWLSLKHKFPLPEAPFHRLADPQCSLQPELS